MLVTTLDALGHRMITIHASTVGWHGGCRVSEVHQYYVITSPSLYVIFVIFPYIHLFIHEIVCDVL